MNYRGLGKTDLMVSEIGFGGWGIGGKDWGPTDDRLSARALFAAFDAGITFYDTAPSYGKSELLISHVFKAWNRDKVVICTKTVDGNIDESLRHFGHIDVLLTHHVPAITDAIREKMEGFVKAGHVRVWGLSAMFPADGLDATEQGAQVVEANLSMMDERAIHCQLLDYTPIIARTPLNFGFLSGTITRETVFPCGDHRWNWPRPKIEAWIDRAKECLGDTPPGKQSVRKALDWVLAHKVSTVIVGMMTPEQVMENICN